MRMTPNTFTSNTAFACAVVDSSAPPSSPIPALLTLSALTGEGLLEKRRYSERPPRDEYVLTEAGRDFLPVLFAIGAWGRKHRGGGKVTRFFDAEAGTEIDPVTIDRATGAPVGTRPIRIAAPE
jgi:hypothetical protein